MTYFVKLHSRAVSNYTANYVSYDQWETGADDVYLLIDSGVRDMHLQSYFGGEVLKLQVI